MMTKTKNIILAADLKQKLCHLLTPKSRLSIFMEDILKSVNIDFHPPMSTWHQLDPDSAWSRDTESEKKHCGVIFARFTKNLENSGRLDGLSSNFSA